MSLGDGDCLPLGERGVARGLGSWRPRPRSRDRPRPRPWRCLLGRPSWHQLPALGPCFRSSRIASLLHRYRAAPHIATERDRGSQLCCRPIDPTIKKKTANVARPAPEHGDGLSRGAPAIGIANRAPRRLVGIERLASLGSIRYSAAPPAWHRSVS
jgi:hypothetical protein